MPDSLTFGPLAPIFKFETEEQASLLRAQGCDEVQGFLYGRPVPAERLIELLETL